MREFDMQFNDRDPGNVCCGGRHCKAGTNLIGTLAICFWSLTASAVYRNLATATDDYGWLFWVSIGVCGFCAALTGLLVLGATLRNEYFIYPYTIVLALQVVMCPFNLTMAFNSRAGAKDDTDFFDLVFLSCACPIVAVLFAWFIIVEFTDVMAPNPVEEEDLTKAGEKAPAQPNSEKITRPANKKIESSSDRVRNRSIFSAPHSSKEKDCPGIEEANALLSVITEEAIPSSSSAKIVKAPLTETGNSSLPCSSGSMEKRVQKEKVTEAETPSSSGTGGKKSYKNPGASHPQKLEIGKGVPPKDPTPRASTEKLKVIHHGEPEECSSKKKTKPSSGMVQSIPKCSEEAMETPKEQPKLAMGGIGEPYKILQNFSVEFDEPSGVVPNITVLNEEPPWMMQTVGSSSWKPPVASVKAKMGIDNS